MSGFSSEPLQHDFAVGLLCFQHGMGFDQVLGVDRPEMVRDGRFKLIYYATGNRTQLFDLVEDPYELNDLAASGDYAAVRQRLTDLLCSELYGDDEGWIQEGQLAGLPQRDFEPWPERGLKGQRGLHWPPPPQDPRGQMVGAPPDRP